MIPLFFDLDIITCQNHVSNFRPNPLHKVKLRCQRLQDPFTSNTIEIRYVLSLAEDMHLTL